MTFVLHTTFTILLLVQFFWVGDVIAQNRDIKLDDIEFSYHGLPLDKSRSPLILTNEIIRNFYLSLIEKVERDDNLPKEFLKIAKNSSIYKKSIGNQFQLQVIDDQKELIKIDFLVDFIINGNNTNTKNTDLYQRQLRKIRQFTSFGQSLQNDDIEENLQKYLSSFEARNTVRYQSCEDSSIPVPPDYGSTLWSKNINISTDDSLLQDGNGISQGRFYPDTEVSFYHSSANPNGLCAMLKRYQPTEKKENPVKVLDLVGVICESYETGRSCFWENNYETVSGEKIKLDKISEKPYSEIQKKWSNSANGIMNNDCLDCHGGNNAFIFYKGHELCHYDLDQNGELVDYWQALEPCFGKGVKNFTKPLGLTAPQDVVILEPNLKGNKCLACHDFAIRPDLSKSHFCALLVFTVGKFMPPNKYKEGLKWSGKGDKNNPYYDSVQQLKTFCKN